MTPADKVELFRVLAGIPRFRDWVTEEEAASYKYLRNADGLSLHRAQGRLQLLDEIRALMDKTPGI